MTKRPQNQGPQQLLQFIQDYLENFNPAQSFNAQKAPNIRKLELAVRSLNLQRLP